VRRSSAIEHILACSYSHSGDDHDYCEYDHVTNAGPAAREVSVKSISMAMGIRKPGFHLLSLVPPEAGRPSFSDALCLMPDQLRIYLSIYIPLAILSILVVTVSRALRQIRQAARSSRQGRVEDTIELKPVQEEDMPLPASAAHPRSSGGWDLTILGHRRRLRWRSKIWSAVQSQCFRPSWSEQRGRRRSLMAGILDDSLNVAIVPISLIVLVALWMFFT
jgi:ethanolamine phosphate phosphodiesterase